MPKYAAEIRTSGGGRTHSPNKKAPDLPREVNEVGEASRVSADVSPLWVRYAIQPYTARARGKLAGDCSTNTRARTPSMNVAPAHSAPRAKQGLFLHACKPPEVRGGFPGPAFCALFRYKRPIKSDIGVRYHVWNRRIYRGRGRRPHPALRPEQFRVPGL